MSSLRLADLPLLARIGLTGVVLTLGLGWWASLKHLENHHAKWDGDPSSVSYQDLVGIYHGLEVPSALSVALESGHPEGLPEEEKDALLEWAKSRDMYGSYDDPDLGYLAPIEILDARCLDCHGAEGEPPPLDDFDAVAEAARSIRIQPPSKEILWTSLHTHALTLGIIVLAVGLLSVATRFPNLLRTLPLFVGGTALALDMASQILARSTEHYVALMIASGAALTGAMALGAVLILLELWLRPANSR